MLVIFDCDGVLVDSEPLAAAVFSESLADVGIHLSPQECYRKFHGHSLEYCFQWLRETSKQPLPNDFGERLALATRESFRKNLQPVAGIVDVLKVLEVHHVTFCVASNGGHKKIAHSLKTTGLDVFFSRARGNCFSIDDVNQGKPAPDLFLHAADAMGVPAAFTTVIEDSPSGMRAAQAAGMKLLVFDVMAEYSNSEHHSFTTMAQLKNFFETRLRR